jgi:hypothetical protein
LSPPFENQLVSSHRFQPLSPAILEVGGKPQAKKTPAAAILNIKSVGGLVVSANWLLHCLAAYISPPNPFTK